MQIKPRRNFYDQGDESMPRMKVTCLFSFFFFFHFTRNELELREISALVKSFEWKFERANLFDVKFLNVQTTPGSNGSFYSPISYCFERI